MGVVRRRTRRRTMMVAGGLAYERGRAEGQQDQSQAEQDYAEPAPPAPPPPDPSVADTTSELERLASLRQSGDLSDDEFAAAKQQILSA